jgi:hypothetical protein
VRPGAELDEPALIEMHGVQGTHSASPARTLNGVRRTRATV